MANSFSLSPVVWGFLPKSPSNGVTTVALSAAATWHARGFTVRRALTINTVREYLTAKTGTLATTDVSCDIYSDTGSGIPNVSLGSTTTVSPALAAATWCEWSGLSVALTANTQYWIVWKNLNGTPASNFPTLRASLLDTLPVFGWGFGWPKVTTVNSGTTWATNAQANVSGTRLGFSDGSYQGFPVENIATGTATYGTREHGIKFTVPSNAPLVVSGVQIYVRSKTASPGSLRARIYRGSSSTPTLIATSEVIAPGLIGSGVYAGCPFASDVTLTPGETIRLVMSQTGGDSSNHYQGSDYTLDNDANSIALGPFNGTCSKTTTTDGTNFTETANIVMPMGLILKADGELAAAGGGIVVPTHQYGLGGVAICG